MSKVIHSPEHIHNGPKAVAWVHLRPDGKANVHVVRCGKPSIVIFDCDVRDHRREEPDPCVSSTSRS